MQIDFSQCTVEELWQYVASHLEQDGISAVLVGGAVATVYTNGAYSTGDLDMVASLIVDARKIEKSMAKIGFRKDKIRHFQHPDCPHLYLEISRAIISIGEQTNIQPVVWDIESVKIKILSPTDCVKDRLASYIHSQGSHDCLELAALVAAQQSVNLEEIEAWCKQEKSSITPHLTGQTAFKDFLSALKRLK